MKVFHNINKGRYCIMILTKELLTHKCIHETLSVPSLIEKIVTLQEGELTSTGSIRVETGKYTGRSPKDRFIVKDNVSDEHVHWGSVNQAISEDAFDKLLNKVVDHLSKKGEIFSFKGFAGADQEYHLPIRV